MCNIRKKVSRIHDNFEKARKNKSTFNYLLYTNELKLKLFDPSLFGNSCFKRCYCKPSIKGKYFDFLSDKSTPRRSFLPINPPELESETQSNLINIATAPSENISHLSELNAENQINERHYQRY